MKLIKKPFMILPSTHTVSLKLISNQHKQLIQINNKIMTKILKMTKNKTILKIKLKNKKKFKNLK